MLTHDFIDNIRKAIETNKILNGTVGPDATYEAQAKTLKALNLLVLLTCDIAEAALGKKSVVKPT